MIVASDFNANELARQEFTTCTSDCPVVVQFGAKSALELATAARFVRPYCSAVDINCGCPQRWACQDGMGSALLDQPELVRDMVRLTREMADVPVCVKIRISDDLSKTVEMAKRVEAVGAQWLTVHGRTRYQKSTVQPNFDAIKLVKENVSLPVLANGSVYSLADAKRIREHTKVDGVMSARGLLRNPALFLGHETVPPECVLDFVDMSMRHGTLPYKIFHNHLMMMLFDVHSRPEKQEFNGLRSVPAVLQFLHRKSLLREGRMTLSPVGPCSSSLPADTFGSFAASATMEQSFLQRYGPQQAFRADES
jgi:tRNA-dihydrouridine synthase 4